MNNLTRDTSSTVHHGDGATTVFTINFAFPDSSAVEVLLRDDATKEEVVQSPGKDYSVTGGGGKSGSVKMRTPPPADKAVIIRSKPIGATALPTVSPMVMIGAAVAGVVIFGLALWFFVFNKSGPSTPTTSSLMQVTAEDITLGSPDAPITMIEYASLGCPHCAEFQAFVFPQIKANYIDKGLVHYVFRDFPHTPAAMSASLVASCMPRDSYLKFAEALFASQQLWEGTNDVKGGLIIMGRRAGMTRERVEQCLADNDKFKSIRAAQERASNELGVNSIPTFFINGREQGPAPFEDFDKIFKGALAQLGVKPQATPSPAAATPPPAETQPPANEPTSPESTGSESDTTPPSP